MSQSESRFRRSIVVIAAAVLFALALIYAGVFTLFVHLMSRPAIIKVGEIRVYSEFAYYGMTVFGSLCLLSAYAGLAAIGRWSRWAAFGQAAGWAVIGLCVYGMWMFMNMIMPGLPQFPIPLGIVLPSGVTIAAGVIGIFLLFAMRTSVEKNP